MLEAEGNSSRPRAKFWPRGQLVLEDLTSLVCTFVFSSTLCLYYACCTIATLRGGLVSSDD